MLMRSISMVKSAIIDVKKLLLIYLLEKIISIPRHWWFLHWWRFPFPFYDAAAFWLNAVKVCVTKEGGIGEGYVWLLKDDQPTTKMRRRCWNWVDIAGSDKTGLIFQVRVQCISLLGWIHLYKCGPYNIIHCSMYFFYASRKKWRHLFLLSSG